MLNKSDGNGCNRMQSDALTFDDWFYREYKSTPDKVRKYQQMGVEQLMREAYEAGKINSNNALLKLLRETVYPLMDLQYAHGLAGENSRASAIYRLLQRVKAAVGNMFNRDPETEYEGVKALEKRGQVNKTEGVR